VFLETLFVKFLEVEASFGRGRSVKGYFFK